MSVEGTVASRDDREVSSEVIQGIQLDSLILWECSVERAGPDATPGQVSSDIHVERFSGDKKAQFTITAKYSFDNHDGERALTVDLVHVATYDLRGTDKLTEDESQVFVRSVLMQVTPFQREMLASLTNRLGLPTFYLPLIRQSELDIAQR